MGSKEPQQAPSQELPEGVERPTSPPPPKSMSEAQEWWLVGNIAFLNKDSAEIYQKEVGRKGKPKHVREVLSRDKLVNAGKTLLDKHEQYPLWGRQAIEVEQITDLLQSALDESKVKDE